MRPDQKERLSKLSEDIAEVFLEESDPNTWNGAGQPLASLDADTRGNRYWDKKNAIQTGTLLARVLDLQQRGTGSQGLNPPSEDDYEKQVKNYESQAKKLIDDIQKQSSAPKARK